MELEIVNFEQAKALKELGFPQEVHPWNLYDIHTGILHKDYDDSSPLYLTENDTCMAPSLELVAKWLRKEKDFHICPRYVVLNGEKFYYSEVNEEELSYMECPGYWYPIRYNTFEEALSAGINKAIEILTKEK